MARLKLSGFTPASRRALINAVRNQPSIDTWSAIGCGCESCLPNWRPDNGNAEKEYVVVDARGHLDFQLAVNDLKLDGKTPPRAVLFIPTGYGRPSSARNLYDREVWGSPVALADYFVCPEILEINELVASMPAFALSALAKAAANGSISEIPSDAIILPTLEFESLLRNTTFRAELDRALEKRIQADRLDTPLTPIEELQALKRKLLRDGVIRSENDDSDLDDLGDFDGFGIGGLQDLVSVLRRSGAQVDVVGGMPGMGYSPNGFGSNGRSGSPGSSILEQMFGRSGVRS